MTFAAGSSHGLSYVEEATYGTTPATPSLVGLRHTSASLGLTKDGFQSNELRSDRQITDFRHGVKQVNGDIGVEYSWQEYDPFFEAAFFGEWQTNVLKAGQDSSGDSVNPRKSFTIQRAFLDITQYGLFTGCMVNQMTMSIKPNGIVTGSFGIIGANASYSGASADGDGSITASKTDSPYDSFTGTILEGGTEIATVTSLDITFANNLEPAFVIGKNYTQGLTAGRFNVTGNMSIFFENLTMLNKFINETESTLQFTLGNGTTKSYTFLFPRIKYTGGDNPASDEGPLTLSMPFQALYASGSGTAAQITRTAA